MISIENFIKYSFRHEELPVIVVFICLFSFTEIEIGAKKIYASVAVLLASVRVPSQSHLPRVLRQSRLLANDKRAEATELHSDEIFQASSTTPEIFYEGAYILIN